MSCFLAACQKVRQFLLEGATQLRQYCNASACWRRARRWGRGCHASLPPVSKSQTIFMCISIRGCDVAQMVVRRLAIMQVRVRFPAWHPREVFPTELTSDEEMERNLGGWRRMNELYECDGMNVYVVLCMYQKTTGPPPDAVPLTSTILQVSNFMINYCTSQVKFGVRSPQSLSGLHVHSRTHWLRPRTPPPPSPAFGLKYEGAIWSAKIDDISL